MYKKDIIEEISLLTTVQKLSIDRLCKQAIKCICSDICDAKLLDMDNLCLDIGIGNLFIYITNDEVKFRFEPSSYLDSSIIDTILTGKNPIKDDIEQSLLNKINTTYKELF